jgi:TonB family protein
LKLKNSKNKTMNRIILLFTVGILLFSFQTNFGQEQSKTAKQRKPIVCADCYNLNGKPISLPKPEYPKAALAVRASGDVGVSILIDENGNVVEAKAISGHPLLRAAAVKAALQAKIRPVIIGGKPVKMYGFITYKFTLDDLQPKNETPKSVTESKQIIDLAVGTIIGKAVILFKPPFPSGCRCKISKNNKIVVQFTVNEKGFVEEAKGISGHPLLRAASVVAIRNSKFFPSSINGMPVKAYGTIVYFFELRKKGWQSRVIKIDLKLNKN